MNDQRSLSGKVAAVTGASSGIGQAIALQLAQAGCDVIVHANRNASGAESTATSIEQAGRKSTVMLCDLAESAGHGKFVEQAWNWRNGIDVWVNNAGADVLTGHAQHWPFERKLEVLWRVDVVATIQLSRMVADRMVARPTKAGTPLILNMGWDQAECGFAGDSGQMFGTIKGAVMAFSKSLAKSLAPQVRVNCLAPGWIRTAWGDAASEYWQQRAQSESLLQRWGDPDDVARAACFLASDAASFINGQTIAINGGR